MTLSPSGTAQPQAVFKPEEIQTGVAIANKVYVNGLLVEEETEVINDLE
ncbi:MULTISPECIES: hypothetical protein [Nostoc]|uniref:Anacyclamide n=1 Tax=Nostoc paludosum FACHB-159 TaxID=2692908 RepID=A0ABR8KB35_9NOSO|nr:MULTISPECIES: hypothetical protein [Nostoc]MBD2680358.1 hypothetical protein [Nostoc sp. FACHB-857]MBD2736746.1 hypothetical protein [Nostoc paludosum FACHB-159]